MGNLFINDRKGTGNRRTQPSLLDELVQHCMDRDFARLIDMEDLHDLIDSASLGQHQEVLKTVQQWAQRRRDFRRRWHHHHD